MKMVMIICPEKRQDDVRDLIAAQDVHAYTEVKEILGEGATGKKFGTHVWPDKPIIIFTVVKDEKKNDLMAALRKCSNSLFPGEGMRAFVMPVEEAI